MDVVEAFLAPFIKLLAKIIKLASPFKYIYFIQL